MNLTKARDLKLELRANLVEPYVRAGRASIAIGVAPAAGRGNYRIAVRSIAEVPADFAEALRREATGEIEFRVTGPIRAALPVDCVVPGALTIGSSIAHYRCTAGTLGFFARRIRDGAIGIVSNNHVLAAQDRGVDGDDILHPAPSDRGRRPKDVVARLDGNYPRLGTALLSVDCAFASLARARSYDARSVGGNAKLCSTIAHPEEREEVVKIGRTTGKTDGRITAFELDGVPVQYAAGLVSLHGQIEVESLTAQPFSRPGDSGSLLFNHDHQPMGLVCAASLFGGTSDSGLTYANRLDSVLEALGVTFVA